MNHIVLLLYILLFSTGFAGLFSLILLTRRYPKNGLGLFTLLQILFMFALALVFVYFYLEKILNLVASVDLISILFGIVLGGQQLAMMYILAKLNATIIKASILKTLVGWVLRLALVFLIGSLLINIFPFNQVLQIFFKIAIYVSVPLALGGFGLLLLRNKGDDEVLTFLFHGLGYSLLLFIPLGIIEAIFAFSSLDPFSMEYITYFGCNAVYVLSAVKAYRRPDMNRVDNINEQAEMMHRRFSLTKREMEMIPFIAKGLTNKEIAYELKISEATVRTHIYNLYQKLEVQSRIGLLNLIKQVL